MRASPVATGSPAPNRNGNRNSSATPMIESSQVRSRTAAGRPAHPKRPRAGSPTALRVAHMVTAEEIGQVPLFAGLDAAQRDELSRVVADIHLVPGEYAADEGAGRALFAVLDGKIEPVKHVDGVARVVGERHPG